MSDPVKHECGIGFIRLQKPLSHFREKYGNALWGMNKLYLLMEKQRNRGQDGAGIASLKINHTIGKPYLKIFRSIEKDSLKDIMKNALAELSELTEEQSEKLHDETFLRENFSFSGEIMQGHVRYGTHGENTIDAIHPFERPNNWRTKNIIVSGNFNLTNTDELFQKLIELGQHPKQKSDTVTILEKIGYYVDEENDRIYKKYRSQGFSKKDITAKIEEELDFLSILKQASKKWDGGYVMQGILGHGDAFVMRDPNGIRPAFYYINDEFVVAASERSPIATVFNIPFEEIKELPPGYVLIVKKNKEIILEKFVEGNHEHLACSFERIYFSRGSDYEIYEERKQLGRLLVPQILDAVNNDLKNTVFSYIPNTAETAFMGLVEGIEKYLKQYKKDKILELTEKNELTPEELEHILLLRPRVEKAAIKDIKLRTFITDDAHRGDMVAHVYDTTHGILERGVDNLVVIDDSIVRGTTLKESILRILGQLSPKKIAIVSSAPQIRYPDCYGIDMSNLGTLTAFNAAIALLKESNQEYIIDEVYKLSKKQLEEKPEKYVNYVNKIYKNFTDEQISKKIAELLRPKELRCEVEIIYQTIENLHKACPKNKGDWYFSGQFPTNGGNKVACQAFVNFYEGRNIRAY
jgi:amidophosphoribosyltransferase